jgi:hypothetical protein
MDLTIRIFNFRIGSLGSIHLSDPMNSGTSTRKTATATTSLGSCSEVNSLVSIKPTRGNTVEELDEIMENLNLEESSGYSDMGSDKNLGKSRNYSEEDFMAC